MAFGTDYNADIVSTKYVLPTIEANTIFIPGITTPMDMHIEGESAYYYVSTDDEVTDGTAGRKLTLGETGFKRMDVALNKSLGLGGIVPGVGRMVDGADVVNTKAVEFTLKTVKKHNELGLAAMATGGTAAKSTSAITKDTVYGEIVDARKEFKAANDLTPKYVIVSDEVEAALLKSDEFIKKEQADAEVVYTGVIGSVAGLVVLHGELPEGTDFIVGCESSFLAPHSIDALEIFGNVEGYPAAAAIQSEYAYGFKVTEAKRLIVKKSA